MWFLEEDIFCLVSCYTKLPLFNDCHVINVNGHSSTQKPQCKVTTLRLTFFLQKTLTMNPSSTENSILHPFLSAACPLIKTCSPSYLLSTLTFLLALFSFPKTSSGLLKVHFHLPVCLCVHKYPLCPSLPCLISSALCSIWCSASDLFSGKKFPLQGRIRILSWEILWIQFKVYVCIRKSNQKMSKAKRLTDIFIEYLLNLRL